MWLAISLFAGVSHAADRVETQAVVPVLLGDSVVVQLSVSKLDSGEIATLAGALAPILWFSPDEKFRPGPLPCDKRAKRSELVLYYQVKDVASTPQQNPHPGIIYPAPFFTESLLEGSVKSSGSLKPGAVDLTEIGHLTLQYLAYYPDETGFGSHEHDIESVDLAISIERRACSYSLRLRRIVGAAHGVEFYQNGLDLDRATDASLPLTILVEEGKHASCPDRNGDGGYTPGYDVNEIPEDAWGLRDALGAGHLGAPSYSAAMSKARKAQDRIEYERSLGELRRYYRGPTEPIPATYRLLSATAAEGCLRLLPKWTCKGRPSNRPCTRNLLVGRVPSYAETAGVMSPLLLETKMNEKRFGEYPEGAGSKRWPLLALLKFQLSAIRYPAIRVGRDQALVTTLPLFHFHLLSRLRNTCTKVSSCRRFLLRPFRKGETYDFGPSISTVRAD